MKIFNKKEEKKKVGRPKLADNKLKKTSLIMCIVCVILSLVLLSVGAYKLNIIPNTNKLKGAVSCSEIPLEFRPITDDNPNGLEHGFTDNYFFSTVVSAAGKTCETMEKIDLANVTYIDLDEYNIDLQAYTPFSNIDGIENLTGLTSLNLYTNENYFRENESIDLSNNTKLVNLKVHDNYKKISSLNINNNFLIESLFIMADVDVGFSHLTNLTSLELYDNAINNLDLSNNTNLSTLIFGGTYDTVNVANTKVSDIAIGNTGYKKNTKIRRIDVSNVEELGSFQSQDADIEEIVLKNNIGLKYFKLYREEKISKIDTKEAPNLEMFVYVGNGFGGNEKLTSIDLSNKTSLTFVRLSFIESLEEVNIKGCVNLKEFQSLYINAKELDFSDSNNLEILNIAHNTHDYLNLSGTKVQTLDLASTIIKKLDISNSNIKLRFEGDESSKKFYDNLKELYMSNNTGLTWIPSNYPNGVMEVLKADNSNIREISLSHNKLRELDVRNCENLDRLAVSDNELTNLDLTGSNNITELFIGNNKFKEDIDISNIKSIEYLSASNVNLIGLDLKKHSSLRSLGLINIKLDKLDLSDNKNLESLSLANNGLKEINLDNNVNLDSLEIVYNDIKKINLENNKELYDVLLINNNTEEVILPKESKIEYLALNQNKLESIDISSVEKAYVQLNDNLFDKTIYMVKGAKQKYNRGVIKEGLTDEITKEGIISINNDYINAKSAGYTTIQLKYDGMKSYDSDYINGYYYCAIITDEEEYNALNCKKYEEETSSEIEKDYILERKVIVYDINSSKYDINTTTKVIDTGGTKLNGKYINLESDYLTLDLKGDTLYLMDGNVVADTYKVINQPEDIEKQETLESNITNNIIKKPVSTFIGSKKKDNDVIELNGSFISSLTMNNAIKNNKKIVLTNNKDKFTINGKDIKEVDNLYLNYNISKLENDNTLDFKMNGVVLNFNNNKFKGKTLSQIYVNELIKENVKSKNINVYAYRNNNWYLIAKDIRIKDNKISFYIDTFDKIIISNDNMNKSFAKDIKYIEINKDLNKSNMVYYIISGALILITIIAIIVVIKNRKDNK